MTIDARPKILLVSTKVDIATDYVVLELTNLGASFFRLNTEDFPLTASSSIRFNRELKASEWKWSSSSQIAIDLTSINCIWYRRHRLPVLPAEISEPHAEYCLRESEWFVKGVIYSKENGSESVAWMSHPSKIGMAESKIYQLTMAQRFGLRIPDTIISNDAEDVRAFFELKGGEVIAKPLRLGYFDYGNRQTSVYTNKVEQEHLNDSASIKIAPVIYQELLPKLYDIRVTVVGEQVFSVAIDSQRVASATIDWRRTDTGDIPHSVHDLPTAIEEACLKYVSALGLNYGALDFVLTPQQEYVFLEINPNGQWVWMEDMLNLPISRAVATWLFRHSQH